MFNNRRITQRVNPAVQQRNDLTALNNIRNKNLEQRVLSRHESSIETLKNKVGWLEATVTGSSEKEEPKEDAGLSKLKEQCDMQSNLLKEYEEKVVNLVGYIKRLEQGLETVKELLTNKTNTEDTMDKVPEFEDEPAKEEEDVTVEKVQEESNTDEAVSESVSLEIVDEETI
jgi:hypothetical protein